MRRSAVSGGGRESLAQLSLGYDSTKERAGETDGARQEEDEMTLHRSWQRKKSSDEKCNFVLDIVPRLGRKRCGR